MKRVILSSFIALLIIGSIAAGYFYYQQLKTPHSDAINAIPPDAAYILECKNIKPTWHKIADSGIWKELSGNSYFKNIAQDIHYLDSAFSANENTQQFLENYPVFISAHSTQNQEYDLLLLINLPPMKQEAFVNDIVNSLTNGKSKINKRIYNGINIREVELKNKKFSYAVSKGILIASFSSMLVDDAISQLKVGRSFSFDNYFKQVYDASGRNVDANLYINYKVFPKLLASYLTSPENNPDVAGISNFPLFANWTGLDLKIKSDGFMLNGFTAYSDTNNYLGVFSNLKPQQIELTKVLPKKTAFMMYMGFDNISAFFTNYKKYLKHTNGIAAYNAKVKQLSDKIGFNVETAITNWVGNEMAMVITEPEGADYTNNSYAVFKARNLVTAQMSLKKLVEISGKKDSKSKEENYKEYPIGYVGIDNLLPDLFGPVFGKVEKLFYTTIGNYIIFGNQASAIRKFIDSHREKKLLVKDKSYIALAENIEAKSNFYIYANVPRSINILRSLASESFAKNLDANADYFNKFNAIAIQFRAKDEMFYNNIYVQQTEGKSTEMNYLWAAQLDTTVSSRPFAVINHKTETDEIIVQDDANNIYLLDSIGEILWKFKADGKILSEIYQVDAFKNNRLQYLFNTASTLYLLDRNGENVEDFPVSFKNKATNGMSLYDYEDKREYRIYIAFNNNTVKALQISGKEIEGWKFDKETALVTNPVTHYRIGGKDYLFFTDNSGNVFILDRKGNVKVDFEKSLETKFNNPFGVENSGNDEKAYFVSTDTTGTIYKIFLDGKVETSPTPNLSPSHFFTLKDLDADGKKEYVFVDKKQLRVYKKDSVAYSFNFNQEINLRPQYFKFSGDNGKLGITDSKSGLIYLFNENGKLYKGFPVVGTTAFTIFKAENGERRLVTGNSDNSIYMYSLEKDEQ